MQLQHVDTVANLGSMYKSQLRCASMVTDQATARMNITYIQVSCFWTQVASPTEKYMHINK